jgi:pyruvate,water dikinase
LGRQALSALFERVASFARMHETLRVILARSYSILRQAIVDTGRRLVRLNPELGADAVWHLSFDELSRAVQYADFDLEALVEERSRCLRQLSRLPSPARRLRELVDTPNPPRLGSRLNGAPTATGQFMGRVRKLSGLSRERPLGAEDVLVGHSFNGSLSLFVGHAGAVVSAAGGTLSHTAFVARQLGVPAVVGVGESLEVLEEGDEVVVDGNDGVLLRTRDGLSRN